MENEIAATAASYVLTRVGILLIFSYVVYRILQPKSASTLIRRERTPVSSRPDLVPDDRC